MADEENAEIEATSENNKPGTSYEQNSNNSHRNNQKPNHYRRKRPDTSKHQDQNRHQQNDYNRERKYNQKRFNTDGGSANTFRNINEKIHDRLAQLCGSTYDLQALEIKERKFSGRNRLFVGNLASDITEDEFKDMFKPFGETTEEFINSEKNFAFIRLDFFANAERAKNSLDGSVVKGRTLKVRFAPNNSIIKVSNLSPFVTNELLYLAFSVFGEIERCVVLVDDRGKSLCEGIIEFVRKPAAQLALKQCVDGCFFLTSSLRPVIVENYEHIDHVYGYPEKQLLRKSPDFEHARKVGPRFAIPGSFEYEYGTRWKQLHELYQQKFMFLKQELKMEEDKLEAQMQFAKFEHETEMLREELRARELDAERKKREWEDRERLVEQRRQQSEMRLHYCGGSGGGGGDEDMRRRQQESSLYMQAHQLSNILDQQEQVIQTYNSPKNNDEPLGAGDAHNNPTESKPFVGAYFESRSRDDISSTSDSSRAHCAPWSNDSHREDYANKRRRYQN